MKKSIFYSAIIDDRGEVDIGYLSLLWGLLVYATSIAVILSTGVYAVWKPAVGGPGVDKIIEAIGSSSVNISAGFAAMLAAVGAFRWGDKTRPMTGTTTTTAVSVEKTEKGP